MAKARIDIEVVQAEVAERRLAQIARAEQRLNVQFKGGVITSEQLRKSTERLNRAKALLTRRLNTNSASLRRGTRAAATMTTTLGSLRSMAAGVGVAFGLWQVTRIIGSATRAAIDFEAEFANVSTLINTETPKGVKQLKLLEEQILALDSRLGRATELTRGLYQALSAGVQPAKAVRFVGEAALFAKAGLTDIFTAVDLLTTVMNAYGKRTEEAAAVSSTLFKIVELGKTTVGLLAGSFGRLAPIAAQLNIELPQLGATLTTLTKSGLSTAEAMTAMAAILNVFVAPEAKQRLDELGISQEKLRDIITKQGLNAALRELNLLLKGDVAATAALFREREAQKGIFTLLGKGTRNYAKDLELLTKAQEDATATTLAADKQFAATKSTISELSAELEKLQIALNLGEAADLAAAALTKIARAARAVIEHFEAVREKSQQEKLFTGFNISVGAARRAAREAKPDLDELEVGFLGLKDATDDAAGVGTGGGGFRKLTEEEKKARKALQEFRDALTGRPLRALFDFNDALDASREGLKGLKAEMDLGPAAQKLDLPNFAVIDAIADQERKLAVLRAQLAGDTVEAIRLQEDTRLRETLANLEKIGAEEKDLARLREILAEQTAVKVAEENQRAFEQMAQRIDFFFQRAALGAQSFSDLFKQIWTQLLSFFISQVSRMVAAWVLGQRTMQAASAGGRIGAGGGFLGGLFGGGALLGSVFGTATAPGGTGTFTGAPIGSRLVSGGGGLAAFGVPGIGIPTGLPPPPAGSATGLAAQGTAMAALGINPLALLASGGIFAALLGRGGNLLLGGLGGAGIGMATALGIGALLGAPMAIGLAAGIIPGLVMGAIGLISAIISRGKKKRQAAAAENVLTAQLGEVVNQFKTFQTDFEGALTSIDQLFATFQGQVKPLGKPGRNAVRNISPLVFAVKKRLAEIQAARDARLLLSASSLIPEFHTGGLVDQRMLALLHPKEAVLNPVGRQAVGDKNIERLNRGETPLGDVTIGPIHIHASPGMDERALAKFTISEIRRAARKRGLPAPV